MPCCSGTPGRNLTTTPLYGGTDMPGGGSRSSPATVNSAPVPSSVVSPIAGKTAVPVTTNGTCRDSPVIPTLTVCPTRTPRAVSVRWPSTMSPAPAGGPPVRATAASDPSGPGPVVTPPTAAPSTVSETPAYVPDQLATAGSAATLRAAGATEVVNCSSLTSASQLTP